MVDGPVGMEGVPPMPVRIEVADGRDEFVRRAAADQGAAYLVVDVDEDFTVEFGVGHLPDRETLGDGQGFQQVADLGCRQVFQQLADLELRAGVEGLGQPFEMPCRFFFLLLFGHDVLPR